MNKIYLIMSKVESRDKPVGNLKKKWQIEEIYTNLKGADLELERLTKLDKNTTYKIEERAAH